MIRSTLHKILFFICWIIFLVLLGFWFLLKPNYQQLHQLQKQEEKLLITITNKKRTVEKAQQQNAQTKTYFEKYPLRALEFVGTLQKDKLWFALIKEPDGQITPVTIDAYLAKEQLQILAIEENALRLTKHKTLFLQSEV